MQLAGLQRDEMKFRWITSKIAFLLPAIVLTLVNCSQKVEEAQIDENETEPAVIEPHYIQKGKMVEAQFDSLFRELELPPEIGPDSGTFYVGPSRQTFRLSIIYGWHQPISFTLEQNDDDITVVGKFVKAHWEGDVQHHNVLTDTVEIDNMYDLRTLLRQNYVEFFPRYAIYPNTFDSDYWCIEHVSAEKNYKIIMNGPEYETTMNEIHLYFISLFDPELWQEKIE